MKLYEVTSGSMGESYVRVYVIADTEKKALEIAKQEYESNGSNSDRLEIELKCNDTSKEWHSDVSDC